MIFTLVLTMIMLELLTLLPESNSALAKIKVVFLFMPAPNGIDSAIMQSRIV